VTSYEVLIHKKLAKSTKNLTKNHLEKFAKSQTTDCFAKSGASAWMLMVLIFPFVRSQFSIQAQVYKS